jgi:hypothetical protein
MLLSASALTLLTACVNDNDICPDSGNGDAVTANFRFTVVTRASVSSQSRATDLGPVGDQAATADEDALNLADTQFLIFDNNRKLLTSLFPSSVTGPENAVYTATVRVSLAYFDNAVAADRTDIPFYILAVSNCNGIAATAGQTIDEIAASLQYFNAPTNISGTQGWSPSAAQGRFIPMAGLQSFSVSAKQLLSSSVDNPIDISGTDNSRCIAMLRALAKIEVVDGMDNDDFKVNGASLAGRFSTGTILPAIAQWPAYATANVSSVTMPGAPVYNSSTPLLFIEDTAEKDELKAKSVYSAYVPEYLLADIGTGAKPTVSVNLTTRTGDPIVRSFTLASYENNYPEDLNQLRRNHIYRFEITGVTVNMDLTLNYTVCPLTPITAGDISFN